MITAFSIGMAHICRCQRGAGAADRCSLSFSCTTGPRTSNSYNSSGFSGRGKVEIISDDSCNFLPALGTR